MEIVYYKHPNGNFGDDLNAIVWPAVLPKEVLDAPDTVLVGIGSILDRNKFKNVKTRGKKVFVLGSGAAYGALPEDLGDWDILAVRGPLTAELIGRPSTAVTDSAYLLALMPHLAPPAADRSATLFMPHFESLPGCNWPLVAQRAGLEYVNPQASLDDIFAAYARAKLVVTEAMHGAIVADALRIPWIPLAISPQVNTFKWVDWTMSMNLPLAFNHIPAPSLYQKWRWQKALREAPPSQSLAPQLVGVPDKSALLSQFRSRYEASVAAPEEESGGGLGARARSFAKQALAPVLPLFDGVMVDKTVRVLTEAARGEAFLSKDDVMRSRLAGLQEALHVLQARVMQSAL